MTIDLINLKALATAAAANQCDPVALNDYGTAVPPATVLGLIAEIERHRQVNTEGCKPDSSILLSGLPCAAAGPCRSLENAEGCKPDSIADPGEVERLRAEIRSLREAAIVLRGQESPLLRYSHADIPFRVKAAVIRLAERDALLREASKLAMFTLPKTWHERYQALLESPQQGEYFAGPWDVFAERQRQVKDKGHTPERDDQYTSGQLADAASAYAAWAFTLNLPQIECKSIPAMWPWPQETWKPQSQRQMLIKAGALILAEIERLDRQQAREVQP